MREELKDISFKLVKKNMFPFVIKLIKVIKYLFVLVEVPRAYRYKVRADEK